MTSNAYSIEAKDINQDLFGHVRYVLDTPAVSRNSLSEHLKLLRHEAVSIRALLAERIPVWAAGAYGSARELVSIPAKGGESGGK